VQPWTAISLAARREFFPSSIQVSSVKYRSQAASTVLPIPLYARAYVPFLRPALRKDRGPLAARRSNLACFKLLFAAAATATLTISARDPLWNWGLAIGIFLLAGAAAISNLWNQKSVGPRLCGLSWCDAAVIGISTWGFGQLLAGATVYRYATLDASVRTAALGATYVCARRWFGETHLQRFLKSFSLLAAGISVIAVANAATAGGKILWLVQSKYPDVWGPFLSRNDFAVFLELSLPVTLWLALRPRECEATGKGSKRCGSGQSAPAHPLFLGAAAWMVAAGVASASRAGAALLVLETLAMFAILRRRDLLAKFAVLALVFAVVAGAGPLYRRMRQPDPIRLQIVRSTLKMVAERPWQGFGLGTFPDVYPAYATFDAGARVEHAHNQWLEWAAEGGIGYAGLWLLLAVSSGLRALLSPWGLGIVAIFLHGLVDYPFARMGLTSWIFSFIAILPVNDMREVGVSTH
jgi:hypothetical protein